MRDELEGIVSKDSLPYEFAIKTQVTRPERGQARQKRAYGRAQQSAECIALSRVLIVSKTNYQACTLLSEVSWERARSVLGH